MAGLHLPVKGVAGATHRVFQFAHGAVYQGQVFESLGVVGIERDRLAVQVDRDVTAEQGFGVVPGVCEIEAEMAVRVRDEVVEFVVTGIGRGKGFACVERQAGFRGGVGPPVGGFQSEAEIDVRNTENPQGALVAGMVAGEGRTHCESLMKVIERAGGIATQHAVGSQDCKGCAEAVLRLGVLAAVRGGAGRDSSHAGFEVPGGGERPVEVSLGPVEFGEFPEGFVDGYLEIEIVRFRRDEALDDGGRFQIGIAGIIERAGSAQVGAFDSTLNHTDARVGGGEILENGGIFSGIGGELVEVLKGAANNGGACGGGSLEVGDGVVNFEKHGVGDAVKGFETALRFGFGKVRTVGVPAGPGAAGTDREQKQGGG